jgi:hypothetical protein
MRLREFNYQDKIRELKKIARWTTRKIGLLKPPKITFSSKKQTVYDRRTFGSTTSAGTVWLYVGERNLADIARTMIHELIHCRQFEIGTASDGMSERNRLKIEDEANAMAGRIMREYGKNHVEIYESKGGPDIEGPLSNTYVIPELSNQDAYLQYRFGVALAAARGIEQRREEGAPEFDPESVWGENMIVTSLDPDVGNHIEIALSMMKLGASKRLITGKTSVEPQYVQSTSPLSGFSGYPR